MARGHTFGSHVQLIALPARYLTAGLNYQVTLAGRNFAGWQLDTNLYIYIYVYIYIIYIYLLIDMYIYIYLSINKYIYI